MISKERKDHKYVARVPVSNSGKYQYRYFYDKEAYQAYLKSKNTAVAKIHRQNPNKTVTSQTSKKSLSDILQEMAEKVTDKLDDSRERAQQTINKVVDKAKETANKFYDDKDNIYDVTSKSYDTKLKKVMETSEWKAIVANKDPEYVKKTSDGQTTYLIDDYIAKKKHPILDVVDDIANMRPVTINKVEKDALVAGLKEHFFSTISLGMITVTAASKFLIEKSKLRQGSYDDEVEALAESVEAGKKYVSTMADVADDVDPETVKQVATIVQSSQRADSVKNEAAAVKNMVDEDKIVEAAKLIMASENMPDQVTSNDYYKLAENTLTNLSEEEIVMLNILLNSMRNK